MEIVDPRGALREDLKDTIKRRKENYGICHQCRTCARNCKIVMAEGLTSFWCRDKSVLTQRIEKVIICL